LRGGIVDVPDLFIVVEILDRCRMANQCKVLAIERKTAGDQTGIENWNLMGFGQRSRLEFAGQRIVSVRSSTLSQKGQIFYDPVRFAPQQLLGD
jgi:hypothetical protein